MGAVAIMAVAALWRRKAPLAYTMVVGVIADALSGGLQSLTAATLTGAYIVLLPTYSVAAWSDRRRAAAGLAFWWAGVSLAAVVEHAPLGDLIASGATSTALWVAGRVLRRWRQLNQDLRQASARLEAENEDRRLLAVAAERTRIAADLHGVIATSISAMVVQARAAEDIIATDPDHADSAMAAVEDAGRIALVEVRRVLGVLRRRAGGAAPAPPVIDQINYLTTRANLSGSGAVADAGSAG
jgi:signal transduction histidine kinase